MSVNANRQDQVKWGILGCATVAEKVMIPGIQQSHNGTVIAVASRSQQKAEKFAQSFGIDKVYGNYDAILEDDDVQAVYIPLANSLHCEWTIRAAGRGKHILCEKPLSRNVSEAREMIDACRRYGVLLMEAFAQRFHHHNVQVRQLVNEGRIGKILRMTAVHSSARPAAGNIRLSKELAGGVLMDKGCYCINTARFIFGSEPTSVYATIELGKDSGVDERVICTIQFPCGGVLQFDTSFSLAENSTYQQSYELFGDNGHIYMPKGLGQVEMYRYGELVETNFFIGDDAAMNTKTEKIVCPPVNQYQFEAEYFADCILKNQPIEHPAENGLANMKVIDAIYESAKKGRPVEIAAESISIQYE